MKVEVDLTISSWRERKYLSMLIDQPLEKQEYVVAVDDRYHVDHTYLEWFYYILGSDGYKDKDNVIFAMRKDRGISQQKLRRRYQM